MKRWISILILSLIIGVAISVHTMGYVYGNVGFTSGKLKKQSLTEGTVFNKATYNEVEFNDIKALVTSADTYFRIDDLNNITDFKFDYNIETEELTYISNGDECCLEMDKYRLVVKYMNEVYVSMCFLQECMGEWIWPEELSHRALEQFEKDSLPDGAVYTLVKFNNITFRGINYKGKTYISRFGLHVKYSIFETGLVNNSIIFNVGRQMVTIDTLKSGNYMVVGLTQYYDFAAFKNAMLVQNKVKTVLDAKNMNIRMTNNCKIVELCSTFPMEIMPVNITEINGVKLKKFLSINNKYTYFHRLGMGKPKGNEKQFAVGEKIAIGVEYIVNGQNKKIILKQNINKAVPPVKKKNIPL